MKRRGAKETIARVKSMLSFLEYLETAFAQHHIDSHQSWGSEGGGRALLCPDCAPSLASALCSYCPLTMSPSSSRGQSGGRAGWPGSYCRMKMSPQRLTMTGKG